ncbi:hypothetical protein FOA43_004219 [Brettanomyces nanus]|uniref:Hcy-binding domain-containing protein n=1 Tax=Eeniella nana TaxID=13502 RepID=A0A875S9L1_EENNA|nr:uncharacterized protein FOA43_004219 [Brettanomyces nanus]QPG76825.1 hypothetical protein FOA43_004219 [Brettanomyces nanus]
MSIKQSLQSGKPLLLDGATGTELEKRGVDVTGKLWSGIAVLHNGEQLEKVYMDYLESGSELIETATYQLSKKALIELNLDPHQTFQKAIDIAHNAQQKFLHQAGKKAFIVGSIGPYGAYLADGSEYSGHYGEINKEKLTAFHSDRLNYLYSSPLIDLIGFETIPNFDEVKVILESMKSLGKTHPKDKQKPFYISLSCSDELSLADGSSLHRLLDYINTNLDSNLVAVGANCCKLRTSAVLIEKLDLEFGNFSKLDAQCKIIIYPNSGEIYNGKTNTWSIDKKLETEDLSKAFEKVASKFLQKKRLGIVGGCCRTGPAEIKLLRKMIDKA